MWVITTIIFFITTIKWQFKWWNTNITLGAVVLYVENKCTPPSDEELEECRKAFLKSVIEEHRAKKKN